MSEKWTKLLKTNCGAYKLVKENSSIKCQPLRFEHICFDKNTDNDNIERLLAIDNKGICYLLQLLISKNWVVKKLGFIGYPVSLVSFNPINKIDIIIVLTTGVIKIFRLNSSVISLISHYSIQGHQHSPTWISFNKNYCLTSSRKEILIWNLEYYVKVNYFLIENDKCYIKKALVSSTLNIITTLYNNDILQIWNLVNFHSEMEINLSNYGLKVVKDFIFTDDGRSIVICDTTKLIIFNAVTFSVLNEYNLLKDNLRYVEAKRLFTVPHLPPSIYTGTSKIIAIIFSDKTLRFFDLASKNFFTESLTGICKFTSSEYCQWSAWIEYDGSLNIICFDQLIKCKIPKLKEKYNSNAEKKKSEYYHHAEEHLNYVHKTVNNCLKLSTLRPILQEYGEYPERYRAIIWRELMKLPSNEKAFLELSLNFENSHNCDDNLKLKRLTDFRLANKNRDTLLTLMTVCLHKLFPFFNEENSFIPELVFPFIVVFQKNPLHVYEAILTVLMNFCQRWFEFYPFPPINILGIIENILMEVDPVLMKFYYENGITSTQYAWPLLKSLMSEVLAENEWLILWDHLLSSRRPLLLLMCIIAYNIYSRKKIILLIKNNEDVNRFFGQQSCVRARDIVKSVFQLDRQISERNHPSQYLSDTFKILPRTGPYPEMLVIAEYPKFIVENLDQTANSNTVNKKQFSKCKHSKSLTDTKKRVENGAHSKKKIKESKKSCRVPKRHQREESHKSCNQQCCNKLVCPKASDIYNDQQRNNVIEKFQDDVDDLEEEVQKFLHITHSIK